MLIVTNQISKGCQLKQRTDRRLKIGASVKLRIFHYENTPIQIYRKFHLQKLNIFRYKTSDIFHTFAQNIDCRYLLEPPRRGGSNEYHNLCFEQKEVK